jgi:ABC-type sugar transport system permease subunit
MSQAMKHRTFFWFILPALSAMVLFIALPIVSVFIQSLFVQHEQVLIFGLAVALGVNNLPRSFRGLAIFISLLPFLVATIVGSMILSWMVDGDGIIGATLQNIFNDPSLSRKASTPLMWIMLMVYGVWHTLPFSFITFYAGLQTVPRDTLGAARVDGANKWQSMANVVSRT